MEIITVILLVVISVLLWKIKFGPRFLAANANDWVILEWHKLRDPGNVEKVTWDDEAPMHIEFVPVMGWEYKHGKATPITPPAYQIRSRLNVSRFDNKAKDETLGYWIRDGAVYDFSGMSSGDFWENLSDFASAGIKIEVHGDVPDFFRKKLFEIIAMSEQQQKQENT